MKSTSCVWRWVIHNIQRTTRKPCSITLPVVAGYKTSRLASMLFADSHIVPDPQETTPVNQRIRCKPGDVYKCLRRTRQCSANNTIYKPAFLSYETGSICVLSAINAHYMTSKLTTRSHKSLASATNNKQCEKNSQD